MNPYLSITIRTFTIWLMSAIINGICCGIFLSLLNNDGLPPLILIFIAGACSLLFAVPGFFMFWLMMLYLVNKGFYGRSLFRAAISSTIALSVITAFLSRGLLRIPEENWLLFFIILSPVISIMMHFHQFKKIGAVKFLNQNKQPQ